MSLASSKRKLALVADEHPPLVEDGPQILREDVRVGVDRPVDAVLPDEFAHIDRTGGPLPRPSKIRPSGRQRWTQAPRRAHRTFTRITPFPRVRSLSGPDQARVGEMSTSQ
jgi:hypothetical protein